MKLVYEDFEDTKVFGAEYNPVPNYNLVVADTVNPLYEDLEALGFVLTLASNDVHTIHVNACGKDFNTLHLEANELYQQLGAYADTCFEMCCEDGHFINSINKAKDFVSWDEYMIGERGFSLEAGTQAIIDILNNVVVCITELYNDECITTDIQSTLDKWLRYLNSKMNYFLGRVLQEAKQVTESKRTRKESMMNRSTRRKRICCEHLEYLKLGQPYKMFCEVEDHIDDYNCDTLSLNKGDYIIRDFQFGHLPNGGNKGYIPYKVIDIEYDRDDDISGYWDARKRLHLFDGYEDFYIECYNERFNGIFHKLKKNSVKE